MIVNCETFFSSEPGEVDRKALIDWLQSLPDNHTIEPQEMVHNKLWLKATWVEMRDSYGV